MVCIRASRCSASSSSCCSASWQHVSFRQYSPEPGLSIPGVLSGASAALSTARFTTAAASVSELIEARDEKKLLRFQKQIASYELLIVDELSFVPLSKTGAELLFEMLSQRYERGSTLITSNLPCQEWT